jgi:hypothetical protein
VKHESHEARRERRDRERQAGEAFQKVLRERMEGSGLRLEDLLPRSGKADEGGDDA